LVLVGVLIIVRSPNGFDFIQEVNPTRNRCIHLSYYAGGVVVRGILGPTLHQELGMKVEGHPTLHLYLAAVCCVPALHLYLAAYAVALVVFQGMDVDPISGGEPEAVVVLPAI